MLSLPPAAANHTTPVATGDSLEGADEGEQEEGADSPRDDASTTAQVDDVDEDLPSLTGLDMDRASVGETQVGSDIGDSNLAVDSPAGDDVAEEEGPEQKKEGEHISGEGKDSTQNESSTTNTDEAADSDSRTVDTAATSTSIDGAAKNGKLMLLRRALNSSLTTTPNLSAPTLHCSRISGERKVERKQERPEQSRPFRTLDSRSLCEVGSCEGADRPGKSWKHVLHELGSAVHQERRRAHKVLPDGRAHRRT